MFDVAPPNSMRFLTSLNQVDWSELEQWFESGKHLNRQTPHRNTRSETALEMENAKRDFANSLVSYCLTAENILLTDLIPILTSQIGALTKEILAPLIKNQNSQPSEFKDWTVAQESLLNKYLNALLRLS
jgi:hypothetical protein